MNSDFHYYATFCAAVLAGYSHEEAEEICTSSQLVDHCTVTFLKKVKGPRSAATTQLQSEMVDARMDLTGRQDITRIWSSFHFLPRDLNAEVKHGSWLYKAKYRLICGPNGALLKDTVELAKGHGLEAIGLAMHILADTWAHTYFAGTPSFVINNTDEIFYEIMKEEDGKREYRKVVFGHNPAAKENPEKGRYTGSLYQSEENNIMNLGHGRAGHLPDYSFIRYVYMPAWNNYETILKDNPSDYLHAFKQMIYALKYLLGRIETFETDTYDELAITPYEAWIREIIGTRRVDSSEDWKAFGESLTGKAIRPFRLTSYEKEYEKAEKEKKDDTYLGRFFLAALAQKSLVTQRIVESGSLLAGYSIDPSKHPFGGIGDYKRLLTRIGEDSKL